MEFKEKLRELRLSRNMTQENVAEYLGVSSQTVSKWERGLLSPDITLLPRIARLYRCSIDSMFGNDASWSIEHREEFMAELHRLNDSGDREGVCDAWMREISLNPDNYTDYISVMRYVLRNGLFGNKRILEMISLAGHAEKSCTDDNIRSEINTIMVRICAKSEDKDIKQKAKYFHSRLPMLKHSRELYVKEVTDADEFAVKVKDNIIRLTDMTECAIRQLITDEMPINEKLYLYKKAAALYENQLDGKFGGFWDVPMLSDYMNIAALSMETEDEKQADEYIERMINIIERHMDESARLDVSVLVPYTEVPNATTYQKSCTKLLKNMINDTRLAKYSDMLTELNERYEKYHKN